jgi:hypothetical protein
VSTRERTGVRDLTYSKWHRAESVARFLTLSRAAKLTMIDIDGCEYCCYCSVTLALIETQNSTRGPKPATVTKRLARDAGKSAYSVSYTPNDDSSDITGFAVRQLWPETGLSFEASPTEYAEWLESLRTEHFAERAQRGGVCAP